MSNTFNKDSDKDYTAAIKMVEQTHDYNALMGFISSGTIAQKQFAVLHLQGLESKNDSIILISNLVNQDGKIREAVAHKIVEFSRVQKCLDFFQDERIYEIFLKAIADVNSNICRQIISVISVLKKNEDCNSFFAQKLPFVINSTFESLEKFKPEDKKHVVNKTIFKLYWYLETIFYFLDCIDFETLKEILLKAGVFYDYTIREKTAKILKIFSTKDKDLIELKASLKNDENYYVRRFLTEK